jgi:predicted PurR-regulated permease PerM
LVLSLLIGLITGVGAAALGLPGAPLLGILAGLLEVLPNIGPILAAIPAILLALLQGSSVLSVSNLVFALIVIVFYLVVQQLENSIIVPRLIGQAVDLPPILIMAGVIVGASVGGILGAFMAAPIIATGRILAQYAYNKIVGRPTYAADEETSLEQAEAAQIVLPETPSISAATESGHSPVRARSAGREEPTESESTPTSASAIEG